MTENEQDFTKDAEDALEEPRREAGKENRTIEDQDDSLTAEGGDGDEVSAY